MIIRRKARFGYKKKNYISFDEKVLSVFDGVDEGFDLFFDFDFELKVGGFSFDIFVI